MYYKGSNRINAKEKILLGAEFERLKSVVEERKLNKRFQLHDLYNRMALKGIAVSFAMAWFIQMTGSFVIINFASLIFEKSGSMLGSRIASIILAVVQIIAGLVSTQFGDTFGRKTTMYISLSGTAVSLFALSVFSYLRQSGYDVSTYLWLPLFCLSLVIFISNAGIIALAHICAIENFPSKVSICSLMQRSNFKIIKQNVNRLIVFFSFERQVSFCTRCALASLHSRRIDSSQFCWIKFICTDVYYSLPSIAVAVLCSSHL